MTKESPVSALQGTRVAHICDRCNCRIRDGEPTRFYATRYTDSGWTLRRVYCSNCGEDTVEPSTATVDEVVGEAIRFNHTLVGVRITDRSRPEASEV